jgi:hypothetical protein
MGMTKAVEAAITINIGIHMDRMIYKAQQERIPADPHNVISRLLYSWPTFTGFLDYQMNILKRKIAEKFRKNK